MFSYLFPGCSSNQSKERIPIVPMECWTWVCLLHLWKSLFFPNLACPPSLCRCYSPHSNSSSPQGFDQNILWDVQLVQSQAHLAWEGGLSKHPTRPPTPTWTPKCPGHLIHIRAATWQLVRKCPTPCQVWHYWSYRARFMYYKYKLKQFLTRFGLLLGCPQVTLASFFPGQKKKKKSNFHTP